MSHCYVSLPECICWFLFSEKIDPSRSGDAGLCASSSRGIFFVPAESSRRECITAKTRWKNEQIDPKKNEGSFQQDGPFSAMRIFGIHVWLWGNVQTIDVSSSYLA